ncbi:hypothetical protein [Pseudomaricurvus sp. HS19]|uniref:hypothetical protein n=1 Tax=Pseudomaricurvus sp. HS19 TaxID=2692626 RepID=UPI001928D99A|nr:hypothetical protein [Pseudomaricurvus sp. HS19]
MSAQMTLLHRLGRSLLGAVCGVAAHTALAAAPATAPVDPHFTKPFIDLQEWRDIPVRHRYVHGGFEGTDTRFSLYLPPKEQYEGRFFQYITPVPDSENLSQGKSGEEDKIGFAIASGAYLVESNGGGKEGMAVPGSGIDGTIGAYRANAAIAQYSRDVAKKFYETDARPWGYAFGGSGGAYRTIGGMENTSGVWDGAVPFVMGSPMAIPNVFSVRMHAMRILHDKFPQILDALEPGGSGDMYAGLNEEEAAALREVTGMGFPPGSWYAWETMGVHAFTVLYPPVKAMDPSYFSDFWSKPGYLGFKPPKSLLEARLQHQDTIKQVLSGADLYSMGIDLGHQAGASKAEEAKQKEQAKAALERSKGDKGTADKAWQAMEEKGAGTPVAIQLGKAPREVGFLGGDLVILSGAAKGKVLTVRALQGDLAIFGMADPKVLQQLQPGDEVRLDNSDFLALQTYHRHQVPGKEYSVWDQFRNDKGEPIYPQRPMLLGPIFTRGAAGTVPTGKFDGKMILLESLWDREAFPWQADWYRARVEEHLGGDIDNRFRLWMTDRALHGDHTQQDDPTQAVSYLGTLQQALRDLAAWVEEGIEPPANTSYRVVEGQVIVPETAAERHGIQPVVKVTANGAERAEIKAGKKVTLKAVIEVPPGTGTVSAAAWDLDGSGEFATRVDPSDLKVKNGKVTVKLKHRFEQSGTWFPVLRATSSRSGEADSPYAQIGNLGRVRVVVK